MGDTVCLMHGSIQGNGLGESVSFGRFMTDQSLSWDKWSTFPNKKYVEEAERYAQRGSVAQKKAFFEAHYKKIAAQKAAALLEQQNAAKTESEPFAVADHNNNNASETDVDAKMEMVVVQNSKQDDIKSVDELNSSIKRPSSKSLLALMNLVHINKEPTNRDPISGTKKSESSPNDSSTPFTNPVEPTDPSAAPGRKKGHKWHILSAICSKPLITEGQRAEKRKQVKPGNGYRKLSCGFCFKARPMTDPFEDGATRGNQIKKAPAMQPRSTKLERSNSNNKHSSISVPPPPPPPTRSVNNSPSMNLSKK